MSNNQTSPDTNTDSEKVRCQDPTAQYRDEFSGYESDVWDYWHRHPHTDDERWYAFNDHIGGCHDCEGLPYGATHCAELFGIKIQY
jgi:hypothetical protein